MARRVRRPSKRQTTAQIAQIIFLLGILVVILVFRGRVGDTAARMVEALGGSGTDDVRVASPPDAGADSAQ